MLGLSGGSPSLRPSRSKSASSRERSSRVASSPGPKRLMAMLMASLGPSIPDAPSLRTLAFLHEPRDSSSAHFLFWGALTFQQRTSKHAEFPARNARAALPRAGRAALGSALDANERAAGNGAGTRVRTSTPKALPTRDGTRDIKKNLGDLSGSAPRAPRARTRRTRHRWRMVLRSRARRQCRSGTEK